MWKYHGGGNNVQEMLEDNLPMNVLPSEPIVVTESWLDVGENVMPVQVTGAGYLYYVILNNMNGSNYHIKSQVAVSIDGQTGFMVNGDKSASYSIGYETNNLPRGLGSVSLVSPKYEPLYKNLLYNVAASNNIIFSTEMPLRFHSGIDVHAFNTTDPDEVDVDCEELTVQICYSLIE